MDSDRIKGVPVQLSGTRRDAYLTFMPGEKRFSGNAGCNTINGNYQIEKTRIHFSEIISTKMSCPDIGFETAFLQTMRE